MTDSPDMQDFCYQINTVITQTQQGSGWVSTLSCLSDLAAHQTNNTFIKNSLDVYKNNDLLLPTAWTSCTLPQTSRPLMLKKSMYKDTDIELNGKTWKMCPWPFTNTTILFHRFNWSSLACSTFSSVLWLSWGSDVHHSMVFEILPLS